MPPRGGARSDWPSVNPPVNCGWSNPTPRPDHPPPPKKKDVHSSKWGRRSFSQKNFGVKLWKQENKNGCFWPEPFGKNTVLYDACFFGCYPNNWTNTFSEEARIKQFPVQRHFFFSLEPFSQGCFYCKPVSFLKRCLLRQPVSALCTVPSPTSTFLTSSR